MSLNLLKHLFIRVSQKLAARLKRLPCPTRACKPDVPIDDHGSPNSSTNFWRLKATYHTAHFGTLPFPSFSFLVIPSPPIGVEGVSPIPPAASDSPALFKDLSATSTRLLGPYYSDFQVQQTIPILFSRVVDDRFHFWLNTRLIILLWVAQSIYHIKNRDVDLRPTLRNLTGEKPISLLPILAVLKNTFDDCDYVKAKLFEFEHMCEVKMIRKCSRGTMLVKCKPTFMFIM